MCLRPLEKFLEGFEVKMFAKNTQKCAWDRKISNSILMDFCQKLLFCHFSCIKNGLWGRMAPKVNALESTDLKASHRYLKHIYATSRKFLEAFEVKTFTQKLLIFAQTSWSSSLDFPLLLKKSLFCHFSCIKNGLWGRMTSKVSALESTDLKASHRYLTHITATSRKFF